MDSQIGYRNMRLKNLIEFGRVVHAEMNAIVDAARRGISIHRATLYCTTFPCHMCARHVIAGGLTRVVFIEPYPKSLAMEIYGDIVSETETPDKVFFEPFYGIAPNFFMKAFRMRPRKGPDGEALSWSRNHGTLEGIVSGVSYAKEEEVILSEILSAIESAKRL